MAYLVNQSRVASLLIGNVNYTSSLVSWSAADSSAFKNGIIQTTGSLVLGTNPGGFAIEDYDRNLFRRGTPVTLDVTIPGGATIRHPRGLLYVISTSYDAESENLQVELGCQLTLAGLTENVSSLLALAPVPLDPAQRTFSNIAASFASAGKCLYQDNQGNLQSTEFFSGDTTASVASGEWVSVLGVTAISATPLAGTAAIPDEIKLSYQVPSDGLVTDQTGKVDIAETESYYYTTYPAISYVRIGTGLNNVTNTTTAPRTTSTSTGCGNTPPQPSGSGGGSVTTTSCSGGYRTEQSPIILPAFRRDKTITTYEGPAGQVSRVYSETRGPAIEANGQYFADKYAYCRYTWGTRCNPNGSCPTEGMNEILLAYKETLNYYGPANELVKTVEDNYETTLAAAQPFDWRSGVVDGMPQDFSTLSTSTMYRSSRVETTYRYSSNGNVQEKTVWTSMASRQTGIRRGSIDALSGIKTFERRTSTTISVNPVVPDMVNTVTTNTTERTQRLPLFSGRYSQPPVEAGPYVAQEQIPVPILSTSDTEITNLVNTYSNYLTRFIKGDAFGVVVAEALRGDICANWRPGMPFRYHDPKKGKTMAMRMDATHWGVTNNEAAIVTNGIWIGDSNGAVTIPSNLVGNSTPNVGGGAPLPPGGVTGPGISGETSVDGGDYAFYIDVHFTTQAMMNFFGDDGVQYPPEDGPITVQWTQTCYVDGISVTAGSLLSPDGTGGIPSSYNGSLVTAGGTIVDADLFA
jgi:hypothetical protein